MSWTSADVQTVLDLGRSGLNAYEIARRTGIPKSTAYRWLGGRTPTRRDSNVCPCAEPWIELDRPAYAYLLGLYLGDGSLARTRRKGVYRLEIYQDARYERLITECAEAMGTVIPVSRVGIRSRPGCVVISSYSKHWLCLLPQHGEGPKSSRRIELAAWQRLIVEQHPTQMLKGLVDSDGCRDPNWVTAKSKAGTRRVSYPRYSFTQKSDDIRDIFCWVCDLLGVHWTRMNWRTIAIARRPDVEFLDTFIGPKS